MPSTIVRRAPIAALLAAACAVPSAPAEPAPPAPPADEGRPAEDAPLPRCPTDGPRIAQARAAWSLTAGGGPSHVAAVTMSQEHAILLGGFKDTLSVGDHLLEGGGTFAAWVDESGRVVRLERIARGDVWPSAALHHAGHLWVALQIVSGGTVGDGAAARQWPVGARTQVLVALGERDTRAALWEIRGGVSHVALAPDEDGVVVTGTLSGGKMDVVRDGGAPSSPLVAAMEEGSGFGPGRSFRLSLPLTGTPAGWLHDGDARGVARLLPAPRGHYLFGRFGGDGPRRMRLGDDGGSELLSVSADDDPSFDVFAARVDGARVHWQQRVRAYGSEPSVFDAVTSRGDLVLLATADGYDTVFDEGGPTEARLRSERTRYQVLARLSPDGARRFARVTPPVSRIHSGACGLWGVGEPEPWFDSERRELDFELADGEHGPLLWFDEDGTLLAARRVSAPPSFTLVPAWSATWLAFGQANQPDAPFAIARFDP